MQRGSLALEKTHQAYLTRWVLPHWRHYELAEVRTIQVESWLRRLPLAKSSCAKIRNLMSVLFNHAWGQRIRRAAGRVGVHSRWNLSQLEKHRQREHQPSTKRDPPALPGRQ
jgi:hypothetical protein